MHDDKTIIDGCRRGERSMQKKLYDRYASKMLVVCLRYGKTRVDAEDILQEAFIRVFNNIHQYRHDGVLEAWIRKIVVNTAINYHRKNSYLYPHLDIEDIKEVSTKDLNISNLHFQELLELIQSLPKGCQAIFNLYAIEGYKHHEIANMLNINEGTSKSQYARAKSILQSMITETGEIKHEKLRK